MNQRHSLNNPHKKLFSIDAPNYDYDYQPFRKNFSMNTNQDNPNQLSGLSLSSSLKYKRFISDVPLNGSSKNEAEIDARFNQSPNHHDKNNLTFINEDKSYNDYIDTHQRFDDQPQLIDKPKVSYESIAIQAQQLLDELSRSHPKSDAKPQRLQKFNTKFNNNSEINNEASQSAPPLILQPILQNIDFFPNRSFGNDYSNDLRNSFSIFCDQNDFNNDDIDFLGKNGFNRNQRFKNILPKSILNQDHSYNWDQDKPPQNDFTSPDFLNCDCLEPNTKRLNTASEMVYPDKHIELLQPSSES